MRSQVRPHFGNESKYASLDFAIYQLRTRLGVMALMAFFASGGSKGNFCKARFKTLPVMVDTEIFAFD